MPQTAALAARIFQVVFMVSIFSRAEHGVLPPR
jgi:hypothetical protein